MVKISENRNTKQFLTKPPQLGEFPKIVDFLLQIKKGWFNILLVNI